MTRLQGALEETDRQRRRCEQSAGDLRSQVIVTTDKLKDLRIYLDSLESENTLLKSTKPADEEFQWEVDALRNGQNILREMLAQERETVTRLKAELAKAYRAETEFPDFNADEPPF